MLNARTPRRGYQPQKPFPAPDGLIEDPVPEATVAAWAQLIDPADPAIYSIASVGLRMQYEFGLDLSDPYIVERAIAAGRRRYAEKLAEAQRVTELSALAAAAMIGHSVVYYMRMGNRVKIGYSARLAGRLATIGPEELMVVEPGGYELEQLRHRQFCRLRVVNEWFSLETPLTEHIERLRDVAVRTITSS